MNRFYFLIFTLGLWGWTAWSCAGDWQYNPQYSYGPVVPLLAFYFLWNRLRQLDLNSLQEGPRFSLLWLIAIAFALWPLEWVRQQLPAQRLILWIQAALAVTITEAWAWSVGGKSNRDAFRFPILFFLLAVPWPTRFEEPLTRGLMTLVAQVTEEGLHWLGILAHREGESIALRSGIVGVSEGCSGIRSLQGAIMVAVASGEIFWLSQKRRLALLGLGILFAFLGNLTRTMTLSWIGETQGIEAIEKLHDTGGSTILLVVTLIIFCLALWMGRKVIPPVASGNLKCWREKLSWQQLPDFRFPVAVAAAGILLCHGWYLWIERTDHPQTIPSFAFHPEVKALSIPPEVWRNLRPTSGAYGALKDSSYPLGSVSYYHFFWRPVARNASGHLHRPDACMGGIGWRLARPVESRTITISGTPLSWYLLAFEKPDRKALQLWGVWKNHEPVTLDFQQGPGAPRISWRELIAGKRRSGVEIVSCVIPYENQEPTNEAIAKALQDAFAYRP